MELDHLYEEDGRLIDFINQNQNIETKKSPTSLLFFPSFQEQVAHMLEENWMA